MEFTDLDLQEDPFGPSDDEQPREHSEGYSILRGSPSNPDDSEEAQGRRAARHLMRVRQAKRLADTKRGALVETIDALEGELARVKLQKSTLDEWERKQCQVDRFFLTTWLREAPQFHEPDRPRLKTLDLADGLAIETKQVTKAAQIVWVDEAAVARSYPQYVVNKPSLNRAEAKKHFVITPDGVVDEDGCVVHGVAVQAKSSIETFALLVDGKRIPLEGETDGSGDDGDNDGSAGADADPFGD